VRIRHYGICSSSKKIKSALIIKAQLPLAVQLSAPGNKATLVIYNPKQCPCCKKETMATLMRFNRRGPPVDWKALVIDLLNILELPSMLKNETL